MAPLVDPIWPDPLAAEVSEITLVFWAKVTCVGVTRNDIPPAGARARRRGTGAGQ